MMKPTTLSLVLSLFAAIVLADNRPAVVSRNITRALPRRAVFAPLSLPGPVLTIDTTPTVDLRPIIKKNALQVKDQGSRNTCSVFAITFLHEYEFATKKGFGMGADFSEEYLNYVKNVANNMKTDGGFFDLIDNGYQAWGCYMLQLVPYKPTYDPNYVVLQVYMNVAKKWSRLKATFVKKWDKTRGLSDAELDTALGYLDKGTPFAAGFLWPTNFQLENHLGIQMMRTPASKNNVFDGHSVAVVGYRRMKAMPGGGYVIFRNSAGPDWGEKGYGYMPFAYLKAYCNDVIVYTP
jgi:hypothetical protein